MKRKNSKINDILLLAVATALLVIGALCLFANNSPADNEPTTTYSTVKEKTPKEEEKEKKSAKDKTETTNPSTKKSIDTLILSFVGDCMLASDHGHFYEDSFNAMAKIQPPEYFFKNFISTFKADDLTIVNCECVLSDNDLQEREKNGDVAFWFKGPASNAEILRVGGVDIAGIVNNHSHDYGQQGNDDTEAALKKAGIKVGKREEVLYTEVKDVKLGIHFCSLYDFDYRKDMTNIKACLQQMKDKDCDLKILFFHGGIENVTTPEDWKVGACHELIDAGADIIVGSHPHVLQRMELYKEKPILYSLGNFCYGGNIRPPRDTAVYQAIFTVENGVPVSRKDKIIPCAVYSGSINNYQPYIVTDASQKAHIFDCLEYKES